MIKLNKLNEKFKLIFGLFQTILGKIDFIHNDLHKSNYKLKSLTI